MIDIIIRCPKEYGGMGSIVGLKYEALKDFVSWAVPDGYDEKDIQKAFLPKLISFGNTFASLLSEKK